MPDLTGPRPDLSPDPTARHNILVMHGEVEGVLPYGGGDRAAMEIPRAALAASRWSYIALGHYHVHTRIRGQRVLLRVARVHEHGSVE